METYKYREFSLLFQSISTRRERKPWEKNKNGRMKSRGEKREGETTDKAREFDISRASDFSMWISMLNRIQ